MRNFRGKQKINKAALAAIKNTANIIQPQNIEEAPIKEWTQEDYDRGLVLVGNGMSLVKKELGNKIDQFKEVVRFNDFDIKLFEKYVGTKTDKWVVNGNLRVNYNRVINKMRIIKEQGFGNNIDSFVMYRVRQAIHFRKLISELYPKANMEEIREEFIKGLWRQSKKRELYIKSQDRILEDIYVPDNLSSGVMVLLMYIGRYPKIWLAGFDHLRNKGGHYNDDRYHYGHSIEHEYVLLQRLESEGLIEELK
jgi:hypothetical protein